MPSSGEIGKATRSRQPCESLTTISFAVCARMASSSPQLCQPIDNCVRHNDITDVDREN